MASKTKCPVCGASQSSVVANCAYCGSEIERAAELKPEEYIAALRTRLDNVKDRKSSFEADEERVRVIQMFTMPSNVECLVEFLTFCDGNSESGKGDAKEAWFGKARAAYGKLRIMALNNPQLGDIIKEYGQRYSTEALEIKKKKENRSEAITFMFAIPITLVLAWYFYGGIWKIIKKIFGME